MLPVWYFIGVVLIIYGVMIFAQGIYDLSHIPSGTVLERSARCGLVGEPSWRW